MKLSLFVTGLLVGSFVLLCATWYRGQADQNGTLTVESVSEAGHDLRCTSDVKGGVLVFRVNRGVKFAIPPSENNSSTCEVVFKVRNDDRVKPLRLNVKSSSCGCTSVVRQFEKLLPGQSGEVCIGIQFKGVLSKETRVEAIEFVADGIDEKRVRLEVASTDYPVVSVDLPKEIPEILVDTTREISVPVRVNQAMGGSGGGKNEVRVKVEDGRLEVRRIENVGMLRDSNGVVEDRYNVTFVIRNSLENGEDDGGAVQGGGVVINGGGAEYRFDMKWRTLRGVIAEPHRLFFNLIGKSEVVKKTLKIRASQDVCLESVDGSDSLNVKILKCVGDRECLLEVEAVPDKIPRVSSGVIKESVKVKLRGGVGVTVPVLILAPRVRGQSEGY